jgi:hypothetical protein
MNNPYCTNNMPHSCEDCGYYYPDDGSPRPICHNDSDEDYTPGDTAFIRENDEGVTYCRICGSLILSDNNGDFPDTCPGCGGNVDWSEWERYDSQGAPSSTAGDYSPSNPWDAPGMSVRDFI